MSLARVLVLDDDREVCAFLSRVLSEIGLSFTICRQAIDLEALQKAGIPFSLIVTTVVPPAAGRVSNLALLGELFPDVPVLHLEEVIPFSVDNFEKMALLRLRAGGGSVGGGLDSLRPQAQSYHSSEFTG